MDVRTILSSIAVSCLGGLAAAAQDSPVYDPCLVAVTDKASIVAAFEAERWTRLTDPAQQVAGTHAAGEIAFGSIYFPSRIEEIEDARRFVGGAHPWGKAASADALLFGRDDAFAAVSDFALNVGLVDRNCFMAGAIFPELDALMAEMPAEDLPETIPATVWQLEPGPSRSIRLIRIEAPGLSGMMLSGRLDLLVTLVLGGDT